MLPKDTKVKIVMHWEDEDGERRPVAELDNIDLETVDTVLSELEYVRVVRCKDCKYWNGEGKYCDYDMSGLADDFCSWGERRDECWRVTDTF